MSRAFADFVLLYYHNLLIKIELRNFVLDEANDMVLGRQRSGFNDLDFQLPTVHLG